MRSLSLVAQADIIEQNYDWRNNLIRWGVII